MQFPRLTAQASDDIVVPAARIFIVDPQRLIRDGLKHNFAGTQHLRVVGDAATPSQAMALLESTSANVLLTDIALRDGDGADLATLVARCAGRVAVLAMSRHATRESVVRAVRAGACGYVLKDGPVEEIVRAVGIVAAGGTVWSTAAAPQRARDRGGDSLLSPREREVLSLIAEGKSSKAIACELQISIRTVECHRHSIKQRLQLVGQAGLVKYAVEHAALEDWNAPLVAAGGNAVR